MKLPLHIAKRYLFSKKSKNIINIISWISIISIGIGSMALIVVLSVFNGLQTLVESMYESFDSDLKITAQHGKTIGLDQFPMEEIGNQEGIIDYTKVIEEIVGVKYKDQQIIATLKAVDDNFIEMSNLDSILIDGSAILESGKFNYAVVGYGIASRTGLYLQENLPLNIYIPKRGKISNLDIGSAFKFKQIMPSAIFFNSPDFDNKYIIVPYRFLEDALEYNNLATAIEIKLAEGIDIVPFQKKLKVILGENYKVTSRYEANALLYKTNQAEKWVTFMILAFILIIAAFNILASLTILIIDKKEDIKILRSMGASKNLIKKIFFTEGILINLIGAGGGLLLGTLICLAQINFGLLKLEGGIVEFYPVEIQVFDFILISFTVLVIGALSSYFPVRILTKKLL